MAIGFDALNQVYNHYLTEYAPKSNTALDTHKKSDLRSIYNSIIQLNKEAPLCILDTSDEAKQYAVSLKEQSRLFRNALFSTKGSSESEQLLRQKVAYSTKESIASASYVGSESGDHAPSFTLSVERLASSQVNFGKAVPGDARISLAPDTYSFDLSVSDMNYEFQFQLKGDDTNREVMERLGRLITKSDVGLSAEVLPDHEGNVFLKLSSEATGKPDGKELQFEISDHNTSKKAGIVSYFGMDQVSQAPENALFEINHIEHTASSNTFTVEKAYEITLQGTSPDPDTVTEIGIKDDMESLRENVHSLADSYNEYIGRIAQPQDAHTRSSQLLSEFSRISRHYAQALSSIGLSFTADGTLQVDDTQLSDAAQADAQTSLKPVQDFANAMLRKSNQISLNPMEYVNKTIVAYKNPGKNYPSPYITSAYSGMLFNNYC